MPKYEANYCWKNSEKNYEVIDINNKQIISSNKITLKRAWIIEKKLTGMSHSIQSRLLFGTDHSISANCGV